MPAMVRELEKLDPGTETEWVLGLVTPLSNTTTALHNLGMSRVDGNHIVIRSASRPDSEQKRTAPQRIEAVALLHEVGHILGEMHARDERDFMYPQLRMTQKEYQTDRARRMMKNLHARFTEPKKRALARQRAEENRQRAQQISKITGMIELASRMDDRKQAMRILAGAGAQLDRMELGKDELWMRLATGFAAQQALTMTEKALARMKSPMPRHATARWAVQTRARVAMPRTGPARISVANEPVHIELINQLIAAITGGDAGKSRKLMKLAVKLFPRSAGLQVARCYRAIYSHRNRVARKHCNRALAIFKGASWAHYLLGYIERAHKRPRKAVPHMKAALAVDPYLEPAWRDLAELYGELKDRAALTKLATEYEAIFKRPLQ
jgi:tetratricopeptide (TPR) repeat protein